MTASRDEIDEIFAIKSRAAHHRLSQQDYEFIESRLLADDPLTRLFAACVVASEQIEVFLKQARKIIRFAIAKREVGGTFLQRILHEALVFDATPSIDEISLIYLLERYLSEGWEDKDNALVLTKRLAKAGHEAAAGMLARWPHPPKP